MCYYCKKYAVGCSWSEGLIPVEGWDADLVHLRFDNKHSDSYMIYDCPEFIEGFNSKFQDDDYSGFVALATAVVKYTLLEYRNAKKALNKNSENFKALKTLKELEQFILSEDFMLYSNLDGSCLLKRMNELEI